MKSSILSFPGIILLIGSVSVLAQLPVCGAEIEAIASKVAKDYVRKRLPDGTFRPETYTFGKGDFLGSRMDPTVDKMDFMDIARIVAVPLARKRYLPTRDPSTTDELIMVYWGTTLAPEKATESNSHMLAQQANDMRQRALTQMGPEGSPTRPDSVANGAKSEQLAESNNALLIANIMVQAENQQREDQDMKTATLLGYDSWWVKSNAAMDGTAMALRKNDMKAELEEDRYFVVLTAFDYRALVKSKQKKFLWEVRFSIRERGNAFDSRLPGMVALASDYFGRDSHGLQHLEVPEGKVEIGPLESLGTVPGK